MRDDVFYLDDILERIERIERYLADDESAFLTTLLVQDAVLQNLLIIGEAARNISSDIRDLAPHIPWRRIVGLRNELIHGYTGYDAEEVWRVIQNDLPVLKKQITDLRLAVINPGGPAS